jgi:hypothetical protein
LNNQVKGDKMDGHVERKGEKRNECTVLVGRQEGRKPLERCRRRWDNNNNKMDHRTI